MTRALLWIDRLGVGLALSLPLFLLHGRVLAEAEFVLLGLLFLLQSVLRRDWTWLWRTWVRIGIVWWGWVVLCSIPYGLAAVGQAAASGHFLLMVAALEHWVLRQARVRAGLLLGMQVAALYIAAQAMLQFATGRNLFGYPRGADGELTGPYQNPRAGAPLSRLLFPTVLPAMDALLRRKSAGRKSAWWGSAWWGSAWAAALLVGGIGVVVLIGQRMPVLLTGLGLAVTALFLPQLRRFAIGAGVAAVLLVAATPVVAPPTFHRLVVKFSAQMEGFQRSHYGLIAERALGIAEAQPFMGAGFDGFRRECVKPVYFHGVDMFGGGALMCVQHPHNFYLQALVEGGIPGLVLFAALAVAWLSALLHGLWGSPDPARVGLFVAALVHLWPIASSTAFTSMPQSGWFFALLGLGLAEAQHYINVRHEREATDG